MAVNIRKFVLQAHSLDELVALETLTAQAARFLEAAVAAGLNVLVSGGTQAGKTTLAVCLVPGETRAALQAELLNGPDCGDVIEGEALRHLHPTTLDGGRRHIHAHLVGRRTAGEERGHVGRLVGDHRGAAAGVVLSRVGADELGGEVEPRVALVRPVIGHREPNEDVLPGRWGVELVLRGHDVVAVGRDPVNGDCVLGELPGLAEGQNGCCGSGCVRLGAADDSASPVGSEDEGGRGAELLMSLVTSSMTEL
jgi:hypothetical protein